MNLCRMKYFYKVMIKALKRKPAIKRTEQDFMNKTLTGNRKLSELLPGENGVISSINDNEIFLKLMEMGCIPGERVQVDIIAPLGDPISIWVAGYQLSLRKNEAEHIYVETLATH